MASIEAVQQVMTHRGLSAAEQAEEWLNVSRSFAEPSWMEACVQRAETMLSIHQRTQAVQQALSSTAQLAHKTVSMPPAAGANAESQFTWYGKDRGVQLEVLRDGIAAMAKQGLISPDSEQQVALRRALGVTVNAAECNSRGP